MVGTRRIPVYRHVFVFFDVIVRDREVAYELPVFFFVVHLLVFVVILLVVVVGVIYFIRWVAISGYRVCVAPATTIVVVVIR